LVIDKNIATIEGSGGGAEERTGTTEKKYYSRGCGGACSTCEGEEKFLHGITGHCGGKRQLGRSGRRGSNIEGFIKKLRWEAFVQ